MGLPFTISEKFDIVNKKNRKKKAMKTILLVEDNKTILLGLQYALEQEQFQVMVAMNMKEALEKMQETIYDMYLLDISFPDGDGFTLCKIIKEKQEAPVIFLTARDEETNVVLGLDMGADDYIIKPFRLRELISRIHAVLRRYEKNSNRHILSIKGVQIDTDNAKVYQNGKEIAFTNLEYKILLMLWNNPNRLLTRETLLERIWDVAGNFVNDNTLTVYMKRIREKLNDKEGNIIETVRGIGYRIAEGKDETGDETKK